MKKTGSRKNRKGESLTRGHEINEAINDVGLTQRDKEKLINATRPLQGDGPAEELSE